MLSLAEYFLTELPQLFEEQYSISSVNNSLGSVFDDENIKTVTNISDYSIFFKSTFKKGFKAGTTQITRTSAKLNANGADLNLNKATNICVIKCFSKKHTPA